MEECPFCTIATGDLPAAGLYEDAKVFVLLDHDSLGLGHCMVVPKRHVRQLHELPFDEYEQVFRVARRLAPGLLDATRKAAVGFVAFRSGLPHAHLHLVPNDEPRELLRNQGDQLGDEQLAANAARLRPFVLRN